MKGASRVPPYVTLYAPLADIAQYHGYALAVHGSVANDMDLIAVPWIRNAEPSQDLAEAMQEHLSACGYPEDAKRPLEWEDKPNGRRAVNLYLGAGSKVDLSVVPFIESARDGVAP